MKTYVTDGQLRLVGKAWEVKEYLKMAMGRVPSGLSLAAFLEGNPAPLKDKPAGSKSSRYPGTLPIRRHTRLQKMPDRPVIPFPSK